MASVNEKLEFLLQMRGRENLNLQAGGSKVLFFKASFVIFPHFTFYNNFWCFIACLRTVSLPLS